MSGRLRDDVNVSGKMEIICAISGLAILINRFRGKNTERGVESALKNLLKTLFLSATSPGDNSNHDCVIKA